MQKLNYTFGFLLEQTLGHVTHAKNLVSNISNDSTVTAKVTPITYDSSGMLANVPICNNWTVRAGLQARRAVSQMQQEDPLDALFVHTQVPAILMTNWVKRIPTVLSMDATPLQYDEFGEFYDHPVGNRFVERIKQAATHSCFHNAKRIVTWSAWAKDGLIDGYQVPEENITVIPPGIDVSSWSATPDQRDEDGPVKILFVGGDLERKGGTDLLNAFRALRDKMAVEPGDKAIELHLVTRSIVSEEPCVFVYNNMQPNSDELRQLFQQCHMFCLPTYGDTLGLAILEAASANLPVISTKLAAIPEIIEDGKSGLLIQPGDVSALVESLEALVTNSSLRRNMGASGQASVRQRFDSKKNTDRLLSLLKHVASENKS